MTGPSVNFIDGQQIYGNFSEHFFAKNWACAFKDLAPKCWAMASYFAVAEILDKPWMRVDVFLKIRNQPFYD